MSLFHRIVNKVGCSTSYRSLFKNTFSSIALNDENRMKAVFTWGVGTDGQLGHAKFDMTSSLGGFNLFGLNSPKYIQEEPRRLLKSKKYTSLALGKTFSLGLTQDGEIYGWGRDYQPKQNSLEPVLIPTDKKITSIAAGNRFAAAIDANGNVLTWGEGGKMFTGGKLGHGSNNSEDHPRIIESFQKYGAKAAQVSCGRDHTLILTDDCEVLACGTCDFGLLGTGSAVDAKVPIPIQALAEEDIIQVAAGRDHSLVLNREGKVFSWGRSTAGQLGHGDSMQDIYSMEDYPRVIESESFGNKRIVQIAAMREKSAAITEDGKLYLWGTRFGQNPVLILPSTFRDMKVIKVVMGGDQQQEIIATITEDHQLWVIGHTNSKMLGRSNASGWNDIPIPVEFRTVKNSKVLDIFAGPGQHMAAIVEFNIK